MTPPRDGDANSADFAPVIPLRRRQPDAHSAAAVELTGAAPGGVWDTDAPAAGLTPRPSVWDQPAATELLLPAPAIEREFDGSGRDNRIAPARERGSRRRGRRRVAQSVAAIAVLATTAVVIALSAGTSHPHLTHAAVRTPAKLPGRAVTRSTTVASTHKPSTLAHHAATRTATRTHKVVRKRRTQHERATQHARHATVIANAHTAPTVAPATTGVPLAPEPQTTSTRSNQTPPPSVAPARGGAAVSCVPGELGC
jgi:hypothetical protein